MGYTANGDYDGVGEDKLQSENVDNKTKKPSLTPEEQFAADSKQKVDQLGENNILNNYRSVTYNFTLAALDNSNLKDPETYRNSELKFVILKSGGKGTQGMGMGAKINTASFAQEARADFAARDPRRLDLTEETKTERKFGAELIAGFNKDSPGRFDMFIENVEIETLMTPSEQTNTSMATKIKFDVIEPYSINGFIEALHISALSAGYPSYLQASFLLKMEFWGYPDNEDLPSPVKINDAERYFPFGLTAMEVEVTERGMRYKCSAVPYNERAFGQPNVVKKPIKMKGTNVSEILNDFFKNINAQVVDSDNESKDAKGANAGHDEYEIKFQEWDPTKGFVDSSSGPIPSAKFNEIMKDNALYAMNDPGDTSKPNAYQADGTKQPSSEQQISHPESIKYNAKDSAIHFGEGMAISDAIASVVRDSEYVKDILKNIGTKPGVPDEYGMLDYFLVKIEVTNLNAIDQSTQKPFQKYTYVVSPYKIHISRIPNYGHDKIKEETLKKLSLREYNYIYTGKNIDVLGFKLNFNTLFFEAVPSSMANKDVVPSSTAAAPNNSPDVKIKSKSDDDYKEASEKDQIPASPVKTNPVPVQSPTGGNASQPKDAYSMLARNMHEAVVNSKASMLTGDLEILGDPMFLVTGGAGNYKPKPGGRGKTSMGEANHNYSEVLITVNFRNPIDFQSLENGGTMYFDPNRVPFSGVYRVLKVVNTFKEGLFKQKLDILRLPGQILDTNLKPDNPKDRMELSPNPDDVVIPDETLANNSPEQRMDSTTVMEQLSRGLPSPGLPDELSNFTNAQGGLGGTEPSMLNQTSGFVSNLDNFSQSSIIGQSLPGDISSNIRLQSSGLVGLSQDSLGPAATIASAGEVLNGDKSFTQSISNSLQNDTLKSAYNISNPGSGIGKGASVLINSNEYASNPTANEIKQGLNINPISLAPGSISNVAGLSNGITPGAIAAVQSMSGNSGKLIGGLENKITSLTSLPSDPQGIAARVGLDPSRLSGLTGGSLQSKLSSQITNIVNSTPDNVNLSQAASAGLALDYLPSSKMPNIPATPQFATAPIPQADPGYSKQVAERGLSALQNLYGVNSPTKLSTNLVPQELIAQAQAAAPSISTNPYSNLTGSFNPVDINSMKDKLATAKTQLSGISNISNNSPLSKLINKFG
jgi:hypothetical protein